MEMPSLRKSVVLGAWMSVGAPLLAGLLGGCAPVDEAEMVGLAGGRSQALVSEGSRAEQPPTTEGGGLNLNGLGLNGLAMNGLSFNGLSFNGLGLNGLAASTFTAWFNAYPASDTDMVMRYVVKCALAEGESRSWTNPLTQTSYTWHGQLGLTQGWASGQPATEQEQQVITACLAAHANKYGAHVPISLLGETAQGEPIPVQEGELETFSQEEGAFFGNLFQGEGIFACQSPSYAIPPPESTWRACALVSRDAQACPPIQVLGRCTGALKCERDPTRTHVLSCHHAGKTYRTLTTRLSPEAMDSLGTPPH